ncbi:hypothetical protein A6A29_38670 [Streptomyces sp. TSRI0281]|nr:hypothetical protein A6A29_38670 [Streptomyces sp. TSRI0281]
MERTLAGHLQEIRTALAGPADRPPHGLEIGGVKVKRLSHRSPVIDGTLYAIVELETSLIPVRIDEGGIVAGTKGEIRHPAYDAMEAMLGSEPFRARVRDSPVAALRTAYEFITASSSPELAERQACPACAGPGVTYTGPAGALVRCGTCGLIERIGAQDKEWSGIYADPSGSYFSGLEADPDGPGAASAHGYEDYEEWVRVILGTAHFDRRARQIARHAAAGARRSLDIGCASGELAGAFGRLGWQASGVDLSSWCIDQARGKYPQATWQVGTAADLKGETFDAVTLMDVFEHFSDPYGELERLRGMLSPGGILALELPNQGSLDAAVLGAGYLFSEHLFFYTPQSIQDMLRHAGFSVLGCWTEHDHYFRADRLVDDEEAESLRQQGMGERLLVIARAVGGS